ncbi:alpha/beta hydrolase [Cellulosimicrobium sp. PMB13]|uniref:alpha/beta hydrolase n=1 Tax=Cellulosimicrobium sp. PMB13 TaxID=3120158 RepID=UPI003F4B4886
MELIFVHGALVRDGEWWWRRAADLLRERTGIRSRALALPSCGETTPEQVAGGLVADAAALRRELDDVDSAIVVGHSYGGTVIAEAGHHPAVAHLFYVSSYLPEVGQSQAAIMSGEDDPVSIGDNGDGTLSVSGYDAASFGARFLQDADATTQRQGWERTSPQAVGAFMTPTSAAGWHGADSTYLVCGLDRSTSVELQRVHAGRATRSVELPTGHHPFLSRPDLVVDQIEVVLQQAPRAGHPGGS